MSELLSNLALGFGVAFTLQNMLYAFGGALLAGAPVPVRVPWRAHQHKASAVRFQDGG